MSDKLVISNNSQLIRISVQTNLGNSDLSYLSLFPRIYEFRGKMCETLSDNLNSSNFPMVSSAFCFSALGHRNSASIQVFVISSKFYSKKIFLDLNYIDIDPLYREIDLTKWNTLLVDQADSTDVKADIKQQLLHERQRLSSTKLRIFNPF